MSFVQHTESSVTIQSGGSTANFGSSTTSGNSILCTLRTTSAQSGIAISVGGQSATLVKQDTSQDPSLYVYIAENITGGAGVSATATWTSNAGTDNYAWLAADEYGNVPSSSVVDTSYSTTGASTTDLTQTGISTGAAGETVFVVAGQNNFATMSAGTDFTLRDAAIVLAGGIEDYVPSGMLSGYTAHFTSTVTNQYTMITVTLKASGSPPGGAGGPIVNGGSLSNGGSVSRGRIVA